VFIKTLIRKKNLTLAANQQRLSHLRQQARQQEELIDLQRTLLNKERERLNNSFADVNDLDIQRLIFTVAHMGKIENRLNAMTADIQTYYQSITELETSTKRSSMEIDKLEDIAQERLQVLRSEALQQEWLALDQWVINRRGGHA
jgi:hypothetical protein